jgi:hypothetical protein
MVSSESGPEFPPNREAMARLSDFYGRKETLEVMDNITVREYWFDEWKKRIANDYDVFVVWTGPVGSGKSSGAIEAATILDPSFTAERIVYTPAELIDMVDRCTAGQVIIYDEAVLGVLATDTFKNEQKALIKTFATMRSKRLVLFLCIPNIFLLAKGIREERMTHWIAIVDRGFAWVHTKNIRVRYKMDPTLGVSIDRVHGPYTWKSIEGTKLWTDYNILKAKRIHEVLGKEKQKLINAEAKELGGSRR